jgi:hypothetical protein
MTDGVIRASNRQHLSNRPTERRIFSRERLDIAVTTRTKIGYRPLVIRSEGKAAVASFKAQLLFLQTKDNRRDSNRTSLFFLVFIFFLLLSFFLSPEQKVVFPDFFLHRLLFFFRNKQTSFFFVYFSKKKNRKEKKRSI